jgi:hypothetical protein
VVGSGGESRRTVQAADLPGSGSYAVRHGRQCSF